MSKVEKVNFNVKYKKEKLVSQSLGNFNFFFHHNSKVGEIEVKGKFTFFFLSFFYSCNLKHFQKKLRKEYLHRNGKSKMKIFIFKLRFENQKKKCHKLLYFHQSKSELKIKSFLYEN